SAESFPLAKTGGLGDVCSALPAALAQLGADVRLMIPAYPQALDTILHKRVVAEFSNLLGEPGCRLLAGYMPDSRLPVLLMDVPQLFRRAGGLYQDADGQDWRDNHRRFAVLCHAAAQVALGSVLPGWRPDIVHANDWHTGLLPALLRQGGPGAPKSVFTIHNLAFQGNFPTQVFPELGLAAETLSPEGLEFYGQVSFLKAGIRYSDRLTTVSPSYAREILTPEHGCGLEGLLRRRAADLVGILNGVNYDIWCPSRDAELPRQYTPDELSGKEACKAALQQEAGLPERPEAPLMIFVNRLTHQKMADIVLEGIPAAAAAGAQIIVHGEGDRAFEAGFIALARQFPEQVVTRIGYAEPLAHRMHAGADIALTPSRFEPCGLTTMYAMRYGAVPVTRSVGGLADTVRDADCAREGMAHGTGFVFDEPSVEELASCMRRAIQRFADGEAWRPLQRRAMKRDFGWERSARRYFAVYEGVLASKAPAPAAVASAEDD
ncbi:MAG: glycogen synthase GlgA, partial [Alphaproteobacteria bacterium]|nr:glycogen synthase GlgA [Alphaproteobacteria bacterium]